MEMGGVFLEGDCLCEVIGRIPCLTLEEVRFFGRLSLVCKEFLLAVRRCEEGGGNSVFAKSFLESNPTRASPLLPPTEPPPQWCVYAKDVRETQHWHAAQGRVYRTISPSYVDTMLIRDVSLSLSLAFRSVSKPLLVDMTDTNVLCIGYPSYPSSVWKDLVGSYSRYFLPGHGSHTPSPLVDACYARRLLLQMLSLLTSLHAEGVCHGNVAPYRIMRDEKLNFFLSDFRYSPSTPLPFHRPSRPSPEIEEEYGPGNDVYALGTVMRDVQAARPCTRTRELMGLTQQMMEEDPLKRPSALQLLLKMGGEPEERETAKKETKKWFPVECKDTKRWWNEKQVERVAKIVRRHGMKMQTLRVALVLATRFLAEKEEKRVVLVYNAALSIAVMQEEGKFLGDFVTVWNSSLLQQMEISILRQNSFSVAVWDPSFLIGHRAEDIAALAVDAALSFACCLLPCVLTLSPREMARKGAELLSSSEKARRRASRSLLLHTRPPSLIGSFGPLFGERSRESIQAATKATVQEQTLSFASFFQGKVRSSNRKRKRPE